MELEEVYLLRYAEVGLKAGNREFFERRLAQNVLSRVEGHLRRPRGRLVLSSPLPREEVLDRLSRVFGLSSFSPARETDPEPEAIREAAFRLAAEEVAVGKGSFKVEVHRADKGFPLTSPELARKLGAELLERFPGLRVDVHRPDFVLGVELREGRAFLFTQWFHGPGGLPVGSGGRAFLLLSGGIDSPVAGWLGMKRGLSLEALHFWSPPYTSEQARDKVVELCRRLSPWGGPRELRVIRFTSCQEEIYRVAPARLGVILMRRLMFRIAEELARREGVWALLTGENLGQVASQTLESLYVIGRATSLLVLRPLLSWDKVETVELAKRIGTYEVSIQPFEDCCSLFVPRHPATRPRLEEVEEAESRLDLKRLITESLKEVAFWRDF